jgi:hypothetical protein
LPGNWSRRHSLGHPGSVVSKRLADAAEKQACTAKSFAASAASINTGVDNAVIKLDQQADDAETFFRSDERAWVVISSVDKTETVPGDSKFGTVFKFGVFPKNLSKN